MMYFDRPTVPRFPETFCSQCGCSFGPGNSGFSHCQDHRSFHAVVDAKTGETLSKSKTYQGARDLRRGWLRCRPEAILTISEQWPTRK